MRKSILLSLAVLFSFNTFAADKIDSKKISAIVDSLSRWVYSVEVINVKGKTTDEMFEDLIIQDQIDEGRVANFPKDADLPEVDTSGDTVGLITLDQALGMFTGFRDSQVELSDKQKTALKNMFLGLKYAGAQFGYSGFGGGSVCGATWPGVIVVDKKAKKFYRFIFVGGEC